MVATLRQGSESQLNALQVEIADETKTTEIESSWEVRSHITYPVLKLLP